MEYGQTAHNRIVYASPPSAAGGSGWLGHSVPTPASTHIFAVAGTLRVPLSQPQNRHIQPGRYATYQAKTIVKYRY